MDKVDEYIASFPLATRQQLEKIRKLVGTIAPEAEEGFNYKMPSYKLMGKPLVYFAGFKSHIGVYALPSSHAAFREKLKSFKTGKGSVQFPIDKPLPLELIKKMILFRKREIIEGSR